MRFFIQEFTPESRTARKLYYLRLEREGVFRGWVMSAGFPEQAGIQRGAGRIGAYRLDQANFEGEVASSRYGRGRVTIRDRGSYRTLLWTDRKIEVRLKGEKVDGTYRLTTERSRKTKGEKWVLEKLKDEPVPKEQSQLKKSPAKPAHSGKLKSPKPKHRRKKAGKGTSSSRVTRTRAKARRRKKKRSSRRRKRRPKRLTTASSVARWLIGFRK